MYCTVPGAKWSTFPKLPCYCFAPRRRGCQRSNVIFPSRSTAQHGEGAHRARDGAIIVLVNLAGIRRYSPLTQHLPLVLANRRYRSDRRAGWDGTEEQLTGGALRWLRAQGTLPTPRHAMRRRPVPSPPRHAHLNYKIRACHSTDSRSVLQCKPPRPHAPRRGLRTEFTGETALLSAPPLLATTAHAPATSPESHFRPPSPRRA